MAGTNLTEERRRTSIRDRPLVRRVLNLSVGCDPACPSCEFRADAFHLNLATEEARERLTALPPSDDPEESLGFFGGDLVQPGFGLAIQLAKMAADSGRQSTLQTRLAWLPSVDLTAMRVLFGQLHDLRMVSFLLVVDRTHASRISAKRAGALMDGLGMAGIAAKVLLRPEGGDLQVFAPLLQSSLADVFVREIAVDAQ